MNNNTELEATGCKDCLLAEYQESGSYYCIHPKMGRYLYEEDTTGKPITPSDCPLLKSSLTISIKQ